MLEARLKYVAGDFVLDVAFEIRSNWTVLFGPSGAGKSTILRILSGLVMPREGRIQLADRLLLDTAKHIAVPAGHRAIGFVSQQAALFPHLTVRENIAFGIHRLPAEKRNARVDEMLAFFWADSLANRKPAQLSGGEKQRVALARALAPKPRLLLLDEPLAALDVAAKEPILANLSHCGVPVLYVSHDLAETWQSDGDAIVIEGGKLYAQGAARKVLASERERLLRLLGDVAAETRAQGTENRNCVERC